MPEAGADSEREVVMKISPRAPVTETVARFTELLSEKGVRVFAVIDQAAEAQKVGLELRDTTLVLFGNPKAGTPVMVASPLAALDLPLKVVIWADGQQTNVSYPATGTLAALATTSAPSWPPTWPPSMGSLMPWSRRDAVAHGVPKMGDVRPARVCLRR